MSDLLIRNIPDRLKGDIEKRARAAGRSLSDEAKSLLRKGLLNDAEAARPAGETAYDSMRRAFSGAHLSASEFAILSEAFDDNRRDMGRPSDDLS